MATRMGRVRHAWRLAERQRRFLIAEMSQVRGLMPLLMKPRNGMPWTPAERRELGIHLRCISQLAPYLVSVLMPGGFAVLPVLAWWLDRRRLRRGEQAPG